MILVADGDTAFLEKARMILNRERQVLLASTAAQAFALAENLGIAVALVNLDLPGNGLELIERLQSSDPDLPIIAISSTFDQAAIANVKSLGVTEVLQKPITPAWKPVVEALRSQRRRHQ